MPASVAAAGDYGSRKMILQTGLCSGREVYIVDQGTHCHQPPRKSVRERPKEIPSAVFTG